MKQVRVQGLHRIQVGDKKGELSEAVLEIRYCRLVVLPPIGKQKNYPKLILTVDPRQERGTPHGRDRIDWKLLTDLPVRSRQEAIEKLDWYAMRWKIETFHKILKSGCKAEESKLRTAERLVNLLAVLCILSWRIFWMTMINRCGARCCPGTGIHQLGASAARCLGERQHHQREQKDTLGLSNQGRTTGWLSRSGYGFSTRQLGHVERPVPSH